MESGKKWTIRFLKAITLNVTNFGMGGGQTSVKLFTNRGTSFGRRGQILGQLFSRGAKLRHNSEPKWLRY